MRLGIRVRADRAEVALAQLLPILEAGAEEREVDGAVEYVLYAPAGSLPSLDEIRALTDAVVDVRSEPVEDGWDVRWHEHLRPVRVRELVVRPPWIDGSPDDLVIDPGPFFGAGTHPTTRLCLELLQELPAGGPLCDWGAGTGVLAIAAARLGWSPVTAVELDPAALDVVRANAARNRVEVEVLADDVCEGPPWAPTVMANLPKPVLLDAAGAIVRHGDSVIVAPPDLVIAAGMLAGDVGEVAAAFAPLRERRRLDDGAWAAVVLA